MIRINGAYDYGMGNARCASHETTRALLMCPRSTPHPTPNSPSVGARVQIAPSVAASGTQ